MLHRKAQSKGQINRTNRSRLSTVLLPSNHCNHNITKGTFTRKGRRRSTEESLHGFGRKQQVKGRMQFFSISKNPSKDSHALQEVRELAQRGNGRGSGFRGGGSRATSHSTHRTGRAWSDSCRRCSRRRCRCGCVNNVGIHFVPPLGGVVKFPDCTVDEALIPIGNFIGSSDEQTSANIGTSSWHQSEPSWQQQSWCHSWEEGSQKGSADHSHSCHRSIACHSNPWDSSSG